MSYKMKGPTFFNKKSPLNQIGLIKKIRKIGYKLNKGTVGEQFYSPEEIREYDPERVDPKTGKVLA